MGSDLGLSSPYTLPGLGPVPYLLPSGPADSDERWTDAEHQDFGGETDDGFHWSDAHRWKPPRPGEDVERPPAWLGGTPVGPAPVVETGRADPVLRVFRLGAVLPSGETVAVVIWAASADDVWDRATWDGEPVDIERVLDCAAGLTPAYLDEQSEWALVPGPLTVRAVAVGMVTLAGWGCVTVGVRDALASSVT